jgi:hypothetical protein
LGNFFKNTSIQVLNSTFIKIYFLFRGEGLKSVISVLENIVEKEYLPMVENYSTQLLGTVFNNQEASTWESLSSSLSFDNIVGKNSASILKCFVSFIKNFCENMRLIYFLPNYQDRIEKNLIHICDLLLEKSEQKLKGKRSIFRKVS